MLKLTNLPLYFFFPSEYRHRDVCLWPRTVFFMIALIVDDLSEPVGHSSALVQKRVRHPPAATYHVQLP